MIGVIHVLMVGEPRAWTTSETDVVKAVAGFVARAIVGVEHQASQRDYIDRVERLDRQKSDFLATVSHELRTPLTSISGYLEVIRGGRRRADSAKGADAGCDQPQHGSPSQPHRRRHGAQPDRGWRHRGQLWRCVDPAADARASEELRQRAQAGSIKLEIDTRPQSLVALGDSTSLDRAVVNVLSNAIKFSHPGGVVTLTGTLDQNARRVLITCQDQGLGIPACDLGDLFTRFFRATNAVNKAIPGTGLGLSIAKQIVEDHHGELRLSSVEDEGTTVVIDLPTSPYEWQRDQHHSRADLSAMGGRRLPMT